MRTTMGRCLGQKSFASGFTMVEVLVASTILGIATLGMLGSLNILFGFDKGSRLQTSESKVYSNVLAVIRSNPDLQMINFAPETTTDDTLLAAASLPLAFSETFFGRASDCATCPVKIGYVIRPLAGAPGLLRLVIRIHDVASGNNKELYGLISTL